MAGTVDGRRARGDRTRRLAAVTAADLATVVGLGALSIGQLASLTGLSKSGILTVFESREAVQIAALAEARAIVLEKVIDPAWDEQPGTARLGATLDNWFGYVRDRVFPGGCFMAAIAAEFAGQSGTLPDLARASKRSWLDFIEGELVIGSSRNTRSPQEVATAVLTLDGLMLAANTRYVLLDDEEALDLGQAACRDLLRAW
jgi:AcrR family transcriptional regulator